MYLWIYIWLAIIGLQSTARRLAPPVGGLPIMPECIYECATDNGTPFVGAQVDQLFSKQVTFALLPPVLAMGLKVGASFNVGATQQQQHFNIASKRKHAFKNPNLIQILSCTQKPKQKQKKNAKNNKRKKKKNETK